MRWPDEGLRIDNSSLARLLEGFSIAKYHLASRKTTSLPPLPSPPLSLSPPGTHVRVRPLGTHHRQQRPRSHSSYLHLPLHPLTTTWGGVSVAHAFVLSSSRKNKQHASKLDPAVGVIGAGGRRKFHQAVSIFIKACIKSTHTNEGIGHIRRIGRDHRVVVLRRLRIVIFVIFVIFVISFVREEDLIRHRGEVVRGIGRAGRCRRCVVFLLLSFCPSLAFYILQSTPPAGIIIRGSSVRC